MIPPETALRELIRRSPGQRLPGERELAGTLRISRGQLRALLEPLRREGMIESRQGSGTWAVEDNAPHLRRVALFIDAALKLGDDPFFSLLVEHLQHAIDAAGARCIIDRITADAPLPGPEDGAITLGLAGIAALSRHPQNAPAPLVALLLPPEAAPTRRASVLRLDDAAAGQEAARRLIAQNRTRIVFAGRDTLPAARERQRGAEETATAQGIAFIALPGGLNYAAGLRVAAALPALDTAVGIIAANDWQAVGIRAGLSARGVTPEQVPLVSFDGLPLAREATLGIDSLAVPLADIARDAVAELIRLRRTPSPGGRAITYSLSWKD